VNYSNAYFSPEELQML